ncbi:MAG: DUF362 domain-containing protein [Candidatus Ranarchaeia archaeon]
MKISTANVATAKGENIEKMVNEGVDSLGGIKAFVKSGDTVLIKPNLLMATASRGATTNPQVLDAVIQLVKTANPAKIIVGESSLIGFDTTKAFETTGTLSVIKKAGVHWIDFKKDKYKRIPIPKGKAIDHIHLPQTFLDCDVFINIPTMKTHCQTLVTLSIKNQKGLLTDEDKSRVHEIDLEPCIADYASVTLPMHRNLIIIDGTWAVEGFGPEVPPGEPFKFDVLIASDNAVAADATACRIMDINPRSIPHISRSHKFGLGPINTEDILVNGISIEKLKRPFKRPPKELSQMEGLQIIDGAPCSRCITEFLYAQINLERFGLLDKVKENALTVVMGKKAKIPDFVPGRLLLLGKCTEEYKDRGVWAPGCPPFTFDAISEMIGGKKLEDYVREESGSGSSKK